MVQFALISLIPGLLRKLGDCADPELDNYAKTLVMPTTLKTSDRSSCEGVYSINPGTWLMLISAGEYGLTAPDFWQSA